MGENQDRERRERDLQDIRDAGVNGTISNQTTVDGTIPNQGVIADPENSEDSQNEQQNQVPPGFQPPDPRKDGDKRNHPPLPLANSTTRNRESGMSTKDWTTNLANNILERYETLEDDPTNPITTKDLFLLMKAQTKLLSDTQELSKRGDDKIRLLNKKMDVYAGACRSMGSWMDATTFFLRDQGMNKILEAYRAGHIVVEGGWPRWKSLPGNLPEMMGAPFSLAPIPLRANQTRGGEGTVRNLFGVTNTGGTTNQPPRLNE